MLKLKANYLFVIEAK